MEKVELEAGPKNEFDGFPVGRLAFKLTYLETGIPFPAKVVKFNYFEVVR